MGFTQQHLIKVLSTGMAVFGLWLMYAMLKVNTVRGDEFLSYLHSDPRWSYADILSHIHGGADNSYVHAIVLRWAFATFGHTLFVQRLCSMVCWLLGMCFVYGSIPHKHHSFRQYALPVLIGFSNMGFFLATDGRFYSMLFCLSAASLLLYVHRKRIPLVVSVSVFTVLQLLGLCTSADFVVFQLVFSGGLIALTVIGRGGESVASTGMWMGGIVASAVVYFTLLKIPYFHSYFATGFVTAVPLNTADIITFIRIPFRWLLVPHIPFCSDLLDVIISWAILLTMLGYALRERNRGSIFGSRETVLILIMAIVIVLGLAAQLLLYVTNGYPLWESRYYAPVFFIMPVALFLVLSKHSISVVLTVYIGFCFIRLLGVEYPKITARKQYLESIARLEQEIMRQRQPSLFVEQVNNRQSDVFGYLSDVYVRYPEARTKLFLLSDSTLPERTAYFRRLSDWHYPLGLVSEVDSGAFFLIKTAPVRP